MLFGYYQVQTNVYSQWGVVILRKLHLLEFLDCFYETFIQEGMVSILHSIMEANALVPY